MPTAHNVTHTRPIVARGRHLSEAPNDSAATLSRDIGQSIARTVVHHPETGVVVQRAFLQRVQELLLQTHGASGHELIVAQGACQALGEMLAGMLGERS